MDIIGIGKSGVYFFIQTKNDNFKLHQKINLSNSFSLCANDIDNDNDIDFYVIRRSNQHSFNKEIIGDPNAIIINNEGTYNLNPTKGIASNQIGMSCAIFDINGDNLNDIFITNDFQKNELFIQTENQSFEKLTSTPSSTK